MTYKVPATPPSADETPNAIVLVIDKLMPDTAAPVSLSRMARIARPGRLRTRFEISQKQIAATIVNRTKTHRRSASRLDRSPSPKYWPNHGIFCSAPATPSKMSVAHDGDSSDESDVDLPPEPPVYFCNLSSLTIDGNTAAMPNVTSARYKPLMRRAGRPRIMPMMKHAGMTTTKVNRYGH